MLKINLLFKKTSRTNYSRILRIKNAELSGYCFNVNINIQADFQICFSVPLRNVKDPKLIKKVTFSLFHDNSKYSEQTIFQRIIKTQASSLN